MCVCMQYSDELERRKLIGQQFGSVLERQLTLLVGQEKECCQQRVGIDAVAMEMKMILVWLIELRQAINRSTDAERYVRKMTFLK